MLPMRPEPPQGVWRDVPTREFADLVREKLNEAGLSFDYEVKEEDAAVTAIVSAAISAFETPASDLQLLAELLHRLPGRYLHGFTPEELDRFDELRHMILPTPRK